MAARLPAVKVAHHADGYSMGCPHAEHHARFTGARFHVCAKVAVCFTVIALFEQIHRQADALLWIFSSVGFIDCSSPYRCTKHTCSFYPFILKNFGLFFKSFAAFYCKIYHNLFVDIFPLYTYPPNFYKFYGESCQSNNKKEPLRTLQREGVQKLSVSVENFQFGFPRFFSACSLHHVDVHLNGSIDYALA